MFLTSSHPCGRLSKIPNSQIHKVKKWIFKLLPMEGFPCNFSWTTNIKTVWPKKTLWHIWYWSITFRKLNLTIVKSVQFSPLILWYFIFGIKIMIFWEKQINSGPIFYMSKSVFGTNHNKKTCLYVHEKLQRNPSVGSCIKFFIFDLIDLTIWDFDKRPQGCDEVKNSMGLLQGPRLMAWTT